MSIYQKNNYINFLQIKYIYFLTPLELFFKEFFQKDLYIRLYFCLFHLLNIRGFLCIKKLYDNYNIHKLI